MYWSRLCTFVIVVCCEPRVQCHENYSSIVWSTTPEHAKHLCSIPDDIFLEDLNSVFRAKPEQFTEDGKCVYVCLKKAELIFKKVRGIVTYYCRPYVSIWADFDATVLRRMFLGTNR